MATTRTTDEQAHVAAKLGPDQAQADRRGMTPEQRRELERLIEEARYAMLDVGLAASGRKADGAAERERTAATQRAIRDYLDEVTDYSAAEAVSGS